MRKGKGRRSYTLSLRRIPQSFLCFCTVMVGTLHLFCHTPTPALPFYVRQRFTVTLTSDQGRPLWHTFNPSRDARLCVWTPWGFCMFSPKIRPLLCPRHPCPSSAWRVSPFLSGSLCTLSCPSPLPLLPFSESLSSNPLLSIGRVTAFSFWDMDDLTSKKEGDVSLTCLASDSTLRTYTVNSHSRGNHALNDSGLLDALLLVFDDSSSCNSHGGHTKINSYSANGLHWVFPFVISFCFPVVG